MNAVKNMSNATTFRYLKSLRQKGYVRLETDDKDNRIKYILPTEQLENYFIEQGKAILQVYQNDV